MRLRVGVLLLNSKQRESELKSWSSVSGSYVCFNTHTTFPLDKGTQKRRSISNDKENTTEFQILVLMTHIHCPWDVSWSLLQNKPGTLAGVARWIECRPVDRISQVNRCYLLPSTHQGLPSGLPFVLPHQIPVPGWLQRLAFPWHIYLQPPVHKQSTQ